MRSAACKNPVIFYMGMFILLLFCLYEYGSRNIYGFMIFPDEMGYWAPAAGLLGYDWSTVTSLGPYYSFGYSVLLLPLLAVIKDSIIVYRAALAVNAMLICGGMFLVFRILRALFPKMKRITCAFAAGIALFYPGWIFYMQLTLAEAALMFFYLTVCILILLFLRKEKMSAGIALVLTLAYLYYLHMRSVGIVIAAILSLLIWAGGKKERRKKVAAVLGLLFLLGLAGLCLKQILTGTLYSGATEELMKANLYTGQWDKVRSAFTVSGIKRLINSCIGKLLYLGLASFGLAYWGIAFLIQKLCKFIRNIRTPISLTADSLFYFFLLSGGTVHFLVAAVYAGDGRLDFLVYGRYNEMLLPLLMAFGAVQMLRTAQLLRGTVRILLLQVPAIALTAQWAGQSSVKDIQGYFIPGMSYLLREGDFEPSAFFWKAGGLGLALTAVAAGLFLAYRKSRAVVLLAAVILMETVLGLQISGHYIYPFNDFNYGDMRIADRIREIEDSVAEGGEAGGDARPIYYLYEGGLPFIDLIQFQLRDREITVLHAEETQSTTAGFKEVRPELSAGENLVIAGMDTVWAGQLDENFDQVMEAGHFRLYYNEGTHE